MRKILSLVMCFVLTFSIVACGSKASVNENINEESEVFKIGGIGPTTGGAAIYGTAVKNAIQIAVDELNEGNGINGYKIDFRFEDDEHDVEKAVNAYNTLKDWGMKMLIGTVTSSPCIGVAEETYRDNMFQLTPSGSSQECTTNPNVFRVCFSDPDQGKASAEYISSHNIATKVGVIYDASDVYSSYIYDTFVENSKGLNYEIVAEESFTADSKTDFTTQLNKIKNAGADLVFLPFYYSEAALVLNQANAMDYHPTFFSCDGMDGILTLDNFDTSLAEGVMLLTPFAADATDSMTKDFVAKYQSKYGDVPNQFAADAYDAVYIIKVAAEKGNINPNMSYSEICDVLKNTMTEITVDGLTGKNMQWNQNGEPEKEAKAVVISNGAYKVLD